MSSFVSVCELSCYYIGFIDETFKRVLTFLNLPDSNVAPGRTPISVWSRLKEHSAKIGESWDAVELGLQRLQNLFTRETDETFLSKVCPSSKVVCKDVDVRPF